MTNRIAVNGRSFTRRITGVERYTHEITKRMQPKPQIILPLKVLDSVSGHLWEQFILPAKVQKDKVLWSPANSGPWIVANQVITIHDASFFDHPEWFRPSFAAWTRLSLKILARRVKSIITVSKFSQERLAYHLKIAEKKIHVIPNGVGKPFEPQPQTAIKPVQEKYEISKPYFLFVGTHQPRKNLNSLFRAWKQAKIRDHLLIVAGVQGTVFAETARKPEELENIKWLGYIPDQELPALYTGATAVIVLSFYEGFGLTVLEAMACGTPVIASNTKALSETAGNAALLIDPFSIDEISVTLINISKNRSLANTLRERGLQRVVQFTWEDSANKTQSLLESIE